MSESFDNRLTQHWDSGLPIVDIATLLGAHTRTITRRAVALGLKPRKVNSEFWTDEKTETLKAHVLAGVSYTKIGRLLGCSKNAAISKVHRINCDRPERARAEKAPRAPRVPRAPRERKQTQTSPSRIKFYARKEAKQSFDPQVIPATAKPWTERAPLQCAAPVAGEGADTFSCCQPVQFGSPYCTGHSSRFYVVTERAPRDRRKAA